MIIKALILLFYSVFVTFSQAASLTLLTAISVIEPEKKEHCIVTKSGIKRTRKNL